ncbi:MAG: DNA polymerase IV [Bacilli bacterium]|jgi:DNA polymerase-4|nr:DNA polymerase IV [Bacilli bacterium]
MGKVIFHIDMNCFFVSCEVAENPELKGQNVAVGHVGLDRKGMILAASYEAKAYGIKTTMPIFEAERLCPNLILINPNHELYQEYSRKFFSYFSKITPLVEPASIDEGYLDVTDVCGPNEYVDLAKKIQDDILNLYGLPCSIGIAPNKFLAKMASDMKKPLGITVLRKRDIKELMWPLPIEDLFGAGKKTCAMLREINIKTIGDFATFENIKMLQNLIGENNAIHLLACAHGEGSTNVDPDRYNNVSSISNSHTLDQDEYIVDNIKLLIKVLSNTVQSRMEEDSLRGRTFTLQLKYNNFKMYSKSITIDQPTNDGYKMHKLFINLFDELYDSDFPVRLVGVAVSKLIKGESKVRQMSIFDELDKEAQNHEISKLIKNINDIVGEDSLKMGIGKNKK